MHAIVERIGGVTVRELEVRMSARERESWRQLFKIEHEEQQEAALDAALEAKVQR